MENYSQTLLIGIYKSIPNLDHLTFHSGAKVEHTLEKKALQKLCKTTATTTKIASKQQTAGVESVRHSVCVPVMKTPGDVFHAWHIKVQIFDPEYRLRPRQSCWKTHSPIYKQGVVWPRRLAERVKPSERVRVGGWTDGRVGVGEVRHQLAEHSADRGAHITLRWPPLSLEIFQLGGESFSFSSPNLCLLHLLAASRHAGIVQLGMIGPPWITTVARMPTSPIPLKSPGSVFGMNGDVVLWWCLFCVNGVKWQPCGVD